MNRSSVWVLVICSAAVVGASGLAVETACEMLHNRPIGAPTPTPSSARKVGGTSTLSIRNDTDRITAVYVDFAPDSYVNTLFWMALCQLPLQMGHCSFELQARHGQDLPLGGRYIDAVITFRQRAGCGVTKAELYLNNPAWYDVADVSLVDGYSNDIQIELDGDVIGRPLTPKLNEKVFGLYPIGCDACERRQSPPPLCNTGVPNSVIGCKTGRDVPCQWRGNVLGGSSRVDVVLVADQGNTWPQVL